MKEYLDKVIKADQCAQYVDDIGIAANSVTQLIGRFRMKQKFNSMLVNLRKTPTSTKIF